MVGPEAQKRRRQAVIALASLCLLALPVVYSAVVVPLSSWEQAEVSLALLGFAMLSSLSRPMRPLIVFLSCFASVRYLYWRVSSTLSTDTAPDAVMSIMLLGAEFYGLLVLFLGYFQTIELAHRNPAPLERWPSVDVFVPTYNESMEIVRRTLIGALAIDYPRKQVFVLDDGRRPEIERMARELGCFYLTRPNNAHAKAGNLNSALARTYGELIAIFDADHVPVRSFLRKTAGFFEDKRLALVQTAQHFFNPDPYERNLGLTGRIPAEQTFFYHVVQPGNDFWNSAFFCGSGAVLRRSAIETIGGFKTDTVTEDAHTALELHSRGWSSAYLPLPLSAGLATESLAAHVTQRMRWARGMAQVLRIDCPLFKRGLSLPQRLNYFNAMLHFFFGIPRLVMIAAPLSYLLFGIHPFRADVLSVFAYILPHIGLSTIANSLISENFRHSFWAAVYEVSVAPYTAGVTLLALLSPRLGKFNVTDKGTNVESARFDFETSRGTLVLLGLSVAALMVAFPARLLLFDRGSSTAAELNATLVNAAWVLANLATLVAAASVAYEQPQQRRSPRVLRNFTCTLRTDGEFWSASTLDISENGVRLAFDRPVALPDECDAVISSELGVVEARARRRWCERERGSGLVEAGLELHALDAQVHQRLVEMIFTGEESWPMRSHPPDDPLRSFSYLVTTLLRVTRPRRPSRRRGPRVPDRFRATVDGVEGFCLSTSPFGMLVELTAERPMSMRPIVRLELDAEGGAFAAPARLVSRKGSRLSLEFEWEDAPREAFAKALYRTAERGSRSRMKGQDLEPLLRA